jgi:uncharacterized protein YbjT (DUF2867 family)
MYAVTGITGQVGGAVARTLMAQGEKVRRLRALRAGPSRGWSAAATWPLPR